MAALGDWKCPKCRGICNCSFCRKKQGYCPTGNLLRVAKASGFASVSEMLRSKDFNKDLNVALGGKLGKENSSNGKSSSKSKCKSKGHNEKDGISGTKRVAKNNDGKKGTQAISKSAGGSLKNNIVERDTGTILKSAGGSSKNLVSSKKFQQDLATYSTGGCKRGIVLNGDSCRKLNFEVVQLGKKMETCELRKKERKGNLLEENEDNSLCKERSHLQKSHISEEKRITEENAYIKCSGNLKKRKPDTTGPEEKCRRKIKRENDEMIIIVSSEDKIGEGACNKYDDDRLEKKKLDMKDPEEKCNTKKIKEENDVVAVIQNEYEGAQVDQFGKLHYNSAKVQAKGYDIEMAMPQGVELTKVAKIDFAAEDVGHALQFLEFCEAFGKVLDIKKGQPECLLRELASGECSSHVGDTSIAGFHIKLLSMIQNNLGEEYYSLGSDCTSSWLQALSRYVSDSKYQAKELVLDESDLVCKKYGELSSSKKLRLLTFLCDEALGSVELRNWMNEKNSVYNEEERKGKEIGRRKEREVKMKLQNELARAVLANNGAPLSVSEHQDLVSKIKAEAAHTLADLGIKKSKKSKAIRLEPMLLNGNGCKFWKLRGHSDGNIMLLQECTDVCSGDSVSCTERWFSYNHEEGAIIEKYILGRLSK